MLPTTITSSIFCLFFFFFNDTATTEIYTLSLHDALPICGSVALSPKRGPRPRPLKMRSGAVVRSPSMLLAKLPSCSNSVRSEEHTSELQSQSNLVCRLLLEKKKNNRTITEYWKTYILYED